VKQESRKSKRIAADKYATLVKEIRRQAKEYGYKINIRLFKAKRNTKYRRDMGLNNTYVYGLFFDKKKTIQVQAYGNISRIKILAVLYHELRHAEHVAKRLYREYYEINDDIINEMLKSYSLYNIPENFKIPSLKLGYLAEVDCDKSSRKKMEELGFDIKIGPYPWNHTSCYKIRDHIHNCYLWSLRMLNDLANSKNINDMNDYYYETERVRKILLNSGINVLTNIVAQEVRLKCQIILHDLRTS